MLIGVLGAFEVRGDGGVVADVPGARLRGLLVALALEAGRVVAKATLVDWIWGEEPPADATNALQRLVSRLRKVLPEGRVEGLADGYRLVVEPGVVDAVRFERLVGEARGEDGLRRVGLLREALELWRGAALQDVGLQGSAAFDAAATRLEGLRLAALEDRFDAEIGLGHGAELVGELTDLVAAHPMRERLAAALMRALVAAGRGSEALMAYQRTRDALADALGVDPSAELAELHVALLRGEVGRGGDERKTNLRAELTSFVGKEADVEAVRELISGHRLTSLIGPGGSGKTRLATETARTLVADLPDGAWLVELAAVGPDGDVAQAALAALGVRDGLISESASADLTDRFVAAVRDREALLVLDNCEHVIGAAAAFAHRVLGECRRLRILATSQEPLGITGEALWQVEPLALPKADAEAGEIEASPAVQLLRDRAAAVRGDLVVDGAALATMARICQALDGMPLAIELAAARLRTMSVEQLALRLDDRFRLLTKGSRTALPRHQTLRAVVDWSWELLSDAERAVLRRLSAFAGGASLEAAERVCAGGDVEPAEVLDLLTALTERSLVRTGGDGPPRFRMSNTIREYAAQRLAEAGEAEQARRAHLAWAIDLTETADPHLRRAEQLEWLAVLDPEHDNIGAAMRGALAAGEAHEAMRLAVGSGWYWWLAGYRAEGAELITAAVNTPGEVPDEVRATGYALMVHFASSGRGDEHQAAEWIHEAYRLSQLTGFRHPWLAVVGALERMLAAPNDPLAAWEPLLGHEDPWVRALARLHLGKMRAALGLDAAEAEAYLERALAEFRALGERFGIWFALTELADRLASRGEFARACQYYEEAIGAITEVGAVEDLIPMRSRQAQYYRLLGDEAASAAAMAEAERLAERVTWPDSLGELALSRAELARWSGRTEEARQQLVIAEKLLRDGKDRPMVRAVVHDLRGYLADDLDVALAHRAAACRAAAEVGHPPGIAKVLVGVADLALRRERYEEAARLLGASTALRGLVDRSEPDAGRVEEAVRRRRGDDAFAEAARVGAETDWQRLVEVTLAS